MKLLEGLDQKLEHHDPAATEAETLALPTARRLFLNALGGCRVQDGERAMVIYDVGLRIRNSLGKAVDIEDADFKILREIISKNETGMFAHYQAQLLYILKRAEQRSDGGSI